MNLIAEITSKIAQGLFEFSQHAVNQGITRGIAVTEVRQALQAGEVIEDYPNDKYGSSCLVFRDDLSGQAAAHSMQLSVSPNREDHYRVRA